MPSFTDPPQLRWLAWPLLEWVASVYPGNGGGTYSRLVGEKDTGMRIAGVTDDPSAPSLVG